MSHMWQSHTKLPFIYLFILHFLMFWFLLNWESLYFFSYKIKFFWCWQRRCWLHFAIDDFVVFVNKFVLIYFFWNTNSIVLILIWKYIFFLYFLIWMKFEKLKYKVGKNIRANQCWRKYISPIVLKVEISVKSITLFLLWHPKRVTQKIVFFLSMAYKAILLFRFYFFIPWKWVCGSFPNPYYWVDLQFLF